MPIKEIIAFAIGVATVLFATNPLHFRESLKQTEIQIVRDLGRTNTWGNPSIFTHHDLRGSSHR